MKKQKDLEAGKKKLAEFRKKKAAEKAKKAAQVSQDHAPNGDIQDNQLSETGPVPAVDSDGARASDSFGEAGIGPLGSNEMVKNDVKSSNDLSTDHSISYDHHNSKPSGTSHVPDFSNETNSVYSHQEERNEASGRVSYGVEPDQLIASHALPVQETTGASGRVSYGMEPDQLLASHTYPVQEATSASGRVSYGTEPDQLIPSHTLPVQETISATNHSSKIDIGTEKLSYGNSHSMNNVFGSPEASYSINMNVSPEKSMKFFAQDNSGYRDSLDDSKMFSTKEGPPNSTMKNALFDIGKSYGVHESLDPTLAGSKLTGSSAMFDGIGSSSWSSDRFSGLGSVTSPTTTGNNRRSRPSFLDTINISRGPTATSFSTEPETANPVGSPIDPLKSSLKRNSVNDTVGSGKEVSQVKHFINGTNENRHEYHSKKQNEDFAALEQHIEDLTQEKFSLQRSLEHSQTLAESLAAENSTFTDSYNKQASVVAQLKGEMEMLQQEIKTLLVELESVKLEYSNALMDCNAADERAKLLASEVIGLEEKALRLRSNELKLEREIENRLAEISSLKKKMSSLEKDNQDLQLTISALQEEKKLLQSKIRKASSSGKLADASKSSSGKLVASKSVTNIKDASTSTMGPGDGGASSSTTEIMHGTKYSGSNALNSPYTNENAQFALDELSSTVPPDQMRIFQNISILISELAIEKEELVRALSVEFSHSTKLKESNKELSKKLETQTQRLELLTSQSMSSGNVPMKQLDSRNLHDSTTYADEGDEVVERVLGWILKLFPGGPSRRRTSKLN